tara:strand:+ start:1894 stop:2073 length:180 start_codon:yes stop_codon:yes gene_type:complete
MKFDIKDFNYLGIILALTVALITLNVQYKNDSYTRVMNCFKDIVNEPEFCQEFYKQYRD